MQEILSRVSSWHLKEAYLKNLRAFLSNIEIVKRLERAYTILTEDSSYTIHYVSDSPMTFQFQGERGTYIVIPSQQSCSCPDAARHILCKHRLAIKLILEATHAQNETGVSFSHFTPRRF